MADYLDKFKGLVKKNQAAQILSLLNKKKNSGEIRTMEEFTQRLDSLIREITEEVLTPTLKMYEAKQNEEISVEMHNEMLERVQDDLDTSFQEALNIDEVQRSHEAIVKDVVLKNLRYGIAELESKVALYEFLSQDTNGFDNAIFSTFRESREARSARTINQASSIFVDPRTNQAINDDSAIDPVGERLTLSLDTKDYYDIRGVRQIFDSESQQSTLLVEPATSKLENMLDGASGTYWIQSLLFEEPQSFVKTKLEFDLSGARDINFIEIEPACRYEIFLESIFYLDTNNIVTKLADTNLSITAPAVVQFRTITTKRLILVFRNENYRPTQFEYDPDAETLIEQSINEPSLGSNPSLIKMNDTLNKTLQSPKVKDILGLSQTTPSTFSGYEYEIGFDNIRVGQGNYDATSIYVSTPITLDDIGQIGLKVIETRPGADGPTEEPEILSATYDAGDDRFFHSSIEYWVIKEDLDSNGNILGISKFPILPLNTRRINHERLVLTEKSQIDKLTNDIGYTMFFADIDYSDVKVYRNGILLPNVDLNPIADGWLNETQVADQTPDNDRRMRMKIRIQNPLPNDIFTITYTPATSNTVGLPKTLTQWSSNGLSVVDLVGDLSARSLDNQVVVIERTTNADKIASSVIFLSIIIRSNTADTSLTASVDEYTLAIGSKDRTKFLGIEEV